MGAFYCLPSGQFLQAYDKLEPLLLTYRLFSGFKNKAL